jgi:response regulator of citrate/malate metabolism
VIRVLIVEDDYHVATIHAAYVRRVAGFAVTGHAGTLAGAQAQLRSSPSDGRAPATPPPDLVLVDLFLPDGNGLDLLGSTLGTPDTRPDFLVITAARDMKSVRTAMRLGAVHYLVKPFDFAQIEERLIAYRSMRRRLERIGAVEEREAEQHEVDALYGLLRGPAPLPKGQSAPTMTLIRDLLGSATRELSASEIAGQIGISRSTAQRYLAELARQGHVMVRPHYGTTGRPEHRYSMARAGGGP